MFGLWLRWPAVTAGFYTDDAVQIAMVRGDFPAHRSAFDLFRFADEARDGRALVDFGYDPWWTEPGLKIAMFRPLSSALIALDVHLFGFDARAYHLHSCLWFVALVVASSLFFAEILPPAAASIAIVLFAVEEGVSPPVVWIANRSTLVSCAFGFLALWLHERNRERRGRLPRLGEVALFSLALAGGEYGFSVLAYVLAFEFVSKKPWPEQLRAAAPALAPAVAWLVASAVLGYGVRGSAFYLSPLGDPHVFAHAVRERVPVLLGDLALGIPSRNWVQAAPEVRAWQSFDGIVGMAAIGLLALWASRGLPRRTADAVRALFLGAVVATLPGAGALPEDRLLVPAAAGVAGVLGAFACEAFRRFPPWSRLRRGEVPWKRTFEGVAMILFVPVIGKVHLVSAAEHSRDTAEWMHDTAPVLQKWAMDADIPDAPDRSQCIVLVSATDFTTTANLPWLRRIGGRSIPRCYLRLSEARYAHEIKRVAPNALEVSILGSQFERVFVDSLYRRENRPILKGEGMRFAHFSVDVLATANGNPWLFRVTFDEDLDDPSFVFLHPYPEGLRRIEVPRVGQKLRLPGPSIPPV